jgi:hypothetical protein
MPDLFICSLNEHTAGLLRPLWERGFGDEIFHFGGDIDGFSHELSHRAGTNAGCG